MGIYSHACTRASERGTITIVAALKTTSLYVFIGALRVYRSARMAKFLMMYLQAKGKSKHAHIAKSIIAIYGSMAKDGMVKV